MQLAQWVAVSWRSWCKGGWGLAELLEGGEGVGVLLACGVGNQLCNKVGLTPGVGEGETKPPPSPSFQSGSVCNARPC